MDNVAKKQKKVTCDPRFCGVEDTVKGLFDRFNKISEKLADNQSIMQLQIQRLVDNIKAISKIEKQMEKIENKVDKNSQVVWKIIGIGMALAIAGPVILSKLFG